MTKTYTYKQILMGMRNEFLEINKKLTALEKYIIVEEKKNEKYYFRLEKREEKMPELILCRKKIERTSYSLLEVLKERFCYRNPTSTIMVKDNNGNYYPLKKGYINDTIDFEEKQEFRKKVEELLNSAFANYINIEKIITAPKEEMARLVPRASFEFELHTKKADLTYYGREDTLKVASVRRPEEKWEPLTIKRWDYISKIEFPKKEFNKYQQAIIEKEIKEERNIILDTSYIPSTYGNFEIREDGKQLVLHKM